MYNNSTLKCPNFILIVEVLIMFMIFCGSKKLLYITFVHFNTLFVFGLTKMYLLFSKDRESSVAELNEEKAWKTPTLCNQMWLKIEFSYLLGETLGTKGWGDDPHRQGSSAPCARFNFSTRSNYYFIILNLFICIFA